MRETLFLRLSAHSADAPLAYALTSGDSGTSNLFVKHAPLSEIAALAEGRETIVFVPASEIRLMQIAIPARQASKALQAAPFLLEDQFAEDVDALHFAVGSRQADGTYPVAALARSRIEGWLAQLADVGILQPRALIPEILALPWQPDTWQALAESDYVIVRTGLCSGFRARAGELEMLLGLADAGAATPTPLRVQLTQSSESDFSQLTRPVSLFPGLSDALQGLARYYQPATAINLLQGPLAARNDWQRYRETLRLPLSLALAAALTALTLLAVEAFQLNRAASRQEAANEDRFGQVFPGETPNPVIFSQQVDSLIRAAEGSGGGTGPFTLMQSLATAQAATPGLTVKALQFRDGALFVDLTGNDLQVLEKLRGWFTAHPGTHMDVQTADSGAQGVRIRLKLTSV